MRIIADTATLYSPEEGAALGMTIIPVCVAINGETYKDYAEISSDVFLDLIEAGGIPTSSQPSIGDVLEVLESCDEEALFLTVGDGLSGAYQTACAARDSLASNDHIHVINSKTLAGPLRYLAHKAVALKEEGLPLEQIKAQLQTAIESSLSFVIPDNFEFLKRSGRLTALTAKIGGALKLLPVLTQTKDKTRIMPVTVKRTWKSAVEAIAQRLEAAGVNERHLVSISHAGTLQKAQMVMQQLRERFATAEMEILQLSPALVTHGGPGCIVVQAIEKISSSVKM